MINKNKKLKAFIRVDGLGNVIPATLEFREHPPKDGRFIQISGNMCCPNSGDINGYILLKNTTASANITGFTTGAYTWTGVLANGQSLIVPLYDSYNYTVSVVVDTPTGRTLTTSVLQGSGTISAIGAITLATNTATTSATQNGQYSIVLN